MKKNIIFDVGGVLIGYRFKEMLMDTGMTLSEAERTGEIVFGDPIWKGKWDRGLISMEELIAHYEEVCNPKDAKTVRYFIENAKLMRVDLPEVWDEVKRLKGKGYNIYLLSNYSEPLFEIHTNGATFFDYLDGSLISYEVHSCKPEPEIYLELLNRYKLEACDCIFFDDTLENVEAAKRLGIEAVHVLSTESLLATLRGM